MVSIACAYAIRRVGTRGISHKICAGDCRIFRINLRGGIAASKRLTFGGGGLPEGDPNEKARASRDAAQRDEKMTDESK